MFGSMCLKKIVSADKDNILSLSQVENPSFQKQNKTKQKKSPRCVMMTSITPTQSHLRSMILFYLISFCVCGIITYKLIDWSLGSRFCFPSFQCKNKCFFMQPLLCHKMLVSMHVGFIKISNGLPYKEEKQIKEDSSIISLSIII